MSFLRFVGNKTPILSSNGCHMSKRCLPKCKRVLRTSELGSCTLYNYNCGKKNLRYNKLAQNERFHNYKMKYSGIVTSGDLQFL